MNNRDQNSLDADAVYVGCIEKKLIDASNRHGSVFPSRNLEMTRKRLIKRYKCEGLGLLTKTFPRLCKALDRALSGEHRLDAGRERKLPNSELPRFLGELFQLVFDKDGWLLQSPSAIAVKTLRGILMPFYKLKTNHAKEHDSEVLAAFKAAEEELTKPQPGQYCADDYERARAHIRERRPYWSIDTEVQGRTG